MFNNEADVPQLKALRPLDLQQAEVAELTNKLQLLTALFAALFKLGDDARASTADAAELVTGAAVYAENMSIGAADEDAEALQECGSADRAELTLRTLFAAADTLYLPQPYVPRQAVTAKVDAIASETLAEAPSYIELPAAAVVAQIGADEAELPAEVKSCLSMFVTQQLQTAQESDLLLSRQCLIALIQYYHLRLAYNMRINLSRISNVADIMQTDIVDCLASALQIRALASTKRAACTEQTRLRVLDIGTGSGIPGLLLAILLPEYDFYLLDTVGKKLSFLQVVIDSLRLNNVKLLWTRAEACARTSYREYFDFVVARAVSALPTLLEYAVPFVKPGNTELSGGHLLCLKNINEQANDSLKAAALLGATYRGTHTYKLASDAILRSIILYDKERSTDKKYPRDFNLPRSKSLDIM